MLTQQKMTEEYYTKKYHTTICLYHLYKDVMSLWTACISITNISMHSHSQWIWSYFVLFIQIQPQKVPLT